MKKTRASALLSLSALGASVLIASGAVVGSGGWSAPPSGGARVDGLVALEQDRSFSDTDFEVGADRRWQFPRLRAAQLEPGESMIFALPGARAIELPLVDRRFVAADTVGFTFSDPDNGGSAEITVRRGRVEGTVRATFGGLTEVWSLRTIIAADGSGDDWYERLDAEADGGAEPYGSETAAKLGLLAETAGSDGGVAGTCIDNGEFIDVLLVYTPGFAALFTDIASLESAMTADVTRANSALANSRALPRLRVAGIEPTLSNSTGSLATDLIQLTGQSDGWADEVHTQRDAANADLVVLYSNSAGANGVASWVMEANTPELGFSVVNSAGGFALTQGIGFNLGCCQAFGDSATCDLGGFYGFSMAYRFLAGPANAPYRTVMAAGGAGTQIPNFSNPTVFFLGDATGAYGDAPATAAQNARTIGLTAYTVANYRCGNLTDTDCDGDGVPDSQAIAQGSVPDCNLTGFPDSCDIATGLSLDLNGDGVPDECPLDEIEVRPSGLAILDTFGSAVAMTSKPDAPEIFTLIGAPGNDGAVSNGGAAYVLTSVAGAVVDVDLIRPIVDAAGAPELTPNMLFGRGTALFSRAASATPSYAARDMAVVGAYRWSPSASLNSKGAIYLFARQPDGSWTQSWRYTAPASGGLSTGANSLFGYSVAFGRNALESREHIVVGCPGRNEARGAVYVCQNFLQGGVETGGNPSLRLLPNALAGDAFGSAVALETEVPTSSGGSKCAFVAGAPGREQNKGAAVIFERSAISSPSGLQPYPSTPAATLSPVGPDAPPVAGDRFGAAVAIRSNLVVVGAPGRNEGRGRIYLWERTATPSPASYVYRGFFTPDDAKPGDAFGSSISIAPSTTPGEFTIIVGAPKTDVAADIATRSDAGKVYILSKAPGSGRPTLLETRISFNPATGDEFGFSVGSTRGAGIVGAPFNDESGLNAGKARIIFTP